MFSMIFAVLMIAAVIGAAILIGIFGGGWVGALAFLLALYALYRLFTHQTGPDRPLSRDRLNAFQRPLSDD